MFYDLDDPLKFVSNIKRILSDNGIWIMEQSYLPTMLKNNSFDTICHEHLEYYSLNHINYCKENNLKIIDVYLNEINGGSFQVYLSHINSKLKINKKNINKLLSLEKS